MLVTAIAVAAAILVLAAYASVYAFWANARHPPRGETVKVEGARLHVERRGERGPLVLALHGASANGREFDAVAAALGDEARMIILDRPGHGHSTRPPGAASLKRQAELIAAALDTLGEERAIVLAHSLGCGVALRFALDFPDRVAGLVLVAPASHPYPGANAWHARLAARPVIGPVFTRLAVPIAGPLMARRAIANTFKPAKPPPGYAKAAGVALLFRPKTFRANAQDVVATKRTLAAQYFRYDEIQAPAIVITADADPVVSPRIHARALARALPKAELVVTPGAGHMPHQVRADAVAAAVLRIAQLGASESV